MTFCCTGAGGHSGIAMMASMVSPIAVSACGSSSLNVKSRAAKLVKYGKRNRRAGNPNLT